MKVIISQGNKALEIMESRLMEKAYGPLTRAINATTNATTTRNLSLGVIEALGLDEDKRSFPTGVSILRLPSSDWMKTGHRSKTDATTHRVTGQVLFMRPRRSSRKKFFRRAIFHLKTAFGHDKYLSKNRNRHQGCHLTY